MDRTVQYIHTYMKFITRCILEDGLVRILRNSDAGHVRAGDCKSNDICSRGRVLRSIALLLCSTCGKLAVTNTRVLLLFESTNFY